jgi:APA family basic amino acid/polyamine antiporter
MGRLRYGTPATALVFSNFLASVLVDEPGARAGRGINTIILLAVMSAFALRALRTAELMIMIRTGVRSPGPAAQGRFSGGIGFAYSLWAIYGAERPSFGFLLILVDSNSRRDCAMPAPASTRPRPPREV